MGARVWRIRDSSRGAMVRYMFAASDRSSLPFTPALWDPFKISYREWSLLLTIQAISASRKKSRSFLLAPNSR